MKKRWRSKSPKSAGPASPDRSGETAAFSDRSGEGASSASASPAREGGVERMQHRRSEGGEGSPSPGEETAVRPKRRRGNVEAALKAYAEEEGNAPAALKEAEEESINQNDDTILKEGRLNDEELLMDQSALHASHSSSRSGDAQEEAPFDGEETMDKKPKPSCSGDCGKIAQDEDEDGHSDKKPSSVLEDEQHSNKIGVHAIEDHKQEQGGARGHVRALLDMDDETILEKMLYFTKLLNFDSPQRDYPPEYEPDHLNDSPQRDYPREYEPDQLIELYEQLALYRIRAYELNMGRKLAELDDASLKMQYPASKIYDKGFFKYYEEFLEWYFDPERCKHARFDNYQRIVLRHCGYLDWDFYHSILNTYEQDLAYVQYFEEVANKTKWIEDYLGDNTIQWTKIEGVAYMQALEIAADFPNVPPFLSSYGFHEYIRSIRSDYSRKGLDCLYFEIWKRVAKGKMSFKEALLEIHSKDMFPLRSSEIKHELENTPYRFPIKDYYDAHVAGIDKMASDHKARQLIRGRCKNKNAEAEFYLQDSEPKYYLDYARKKLDIAEDIDLIPKGRRRGVAQQGKGDNGEAKTEMDD